MTLGIHLPDLFPKQQAIVDHPARFKVLACGRRFGKTQIAVDLMVNTVLDAGLVAYFAPSFRMMGDVWKQVRAILKPLETAGSEHTWSAEYATGGSFDCWSLQTSSAETVRGRKYHLVVIDEAALVTDGHAKWNAIIRPLLTDFKGKALFPSTPSGQNWFWDLYEMGRDPAFPDWHSWTFPTSANPYIDAAEVESARRQVPESVFKQEYLAEFLNDGGAVFRGVDAVCRAEPEAPTEGADYVFGVDWGKDRDFTVISVMERASRRQVFLDRFNEIGWHLQRKRLSALWEKYQPSHIWAEANSIGSVNIEALQAEGLPVRPFITTGKSKAPLIEALALAIEQETVTLLDSSVLKHELKSYTMQRLETGGWRYSAPSGQHDDCVMATAISLHAIGTTARILFSFESSAPSLPIYDAFGQMHRPSREEARRRRKAAGVQVQGDDND